VVEIERATFKDVERVPEMQIRTFEDANQKTILSNLSRGSSRMFGQPRIQAVWWLLTKWSTLEMMREKLLPFALAITLLFGGGILHSESARTTGAPRPPWPSSPSDSCSDGHSDETAIAWVIPGSCTIFAAAHGDTVLFGNNEDYTNPNTYYWVIPSNEGTYGGVYFGFDNLSPQGGINEKGLAFDTNGLPPLDLDPRSELPAAPPGWIVETIMKEAATVKEAIDISRGCRRYNWGLPMKYQVFLADATGDAVVISAGSDGELAFTRKQEGDGYLVSTNFNRGKPENRDGDLPCWRYDTATADSVPFPVYPERGPR